MDTPKVKNSDATQEERTIRSFLVALDGIPNYLGIVENIDSWRLGICKLELKEDGLHVWLRRPGLLIGKAGRTLEKFEEHLDVNILIHEVLLYSSKYNY